MTPEFISAEVRKTRRKDPSELSAWECVMRDRAHIWKISRDDALEAKRLFEKAMELAPGSGLGAADLALVHMFDGFYGWTGQRKDSYRKMTAFARSAVEADENDPLALTILAAACLFACDWEEALAAIDRAVAISPHFAAAVGMRGAILACADEPDLAISTIKKAVELSPQ